MQTICFFLNVTDNKYVFNRFSPTWRMMSRRKPVFDISNYESRVKLKRYFLLNKYPIDGLKAVVCDVTWNLRFFHVHRITKWEDIYGDC